MSACVPTIRELLGFLDILTTVLTLGIGPYLGSGLQQPHKCVNQAGLSKNVPPKLVVSVGFPIKNCYWMVSRYRFFPTGDPSFDDGVFGIGQLHQILCI